MMNTENYQVVPKQSIALPGYLDRRLKAVMTLDEAIVLAMNIEAWSPEAACRIQKVGV